MGGSTRRQAIAPFLVALLVVLPALGAVAAVPAPVGVLPSITIEGDAGFASVLSGVRAGSGTLEDPFVIANWTILRTAGYGILLANTSAHVVIEDITVSRTEAAIPDRAARCLGAVAECGPFVGIQLQNAENVTIRRVATMSSPLLHASHARNVLVEDVARTLPSRLDGGNGITVLDSEDVTVRRVDVFAREAAVVALRTDRFTLEDSNIRGDLIGWVELEGGTDLVARNNTFASAYLLAYGPASGVRFEDNTFARGGLGASGDTDAPVQALLACGNAFTGHYDLLWLTGVGGAHVVGNRFAGGGTYADFAEVEGLLYDRNDHAAQSWGAWFQAQGARIHANAFHAASSGATVLQTANATGNWWGASDGPSGDGAGSGAPLHALQPTPYAPWLEEAPDTAVDCGSLPLPAAAPLPVVRSETIEVPGGAAWRAHIQAEGDDSVSILGYSETVGAEALSFSVNYDPETMEVLRADRGFSAFWGGAIHAEATAAGASIHQHVQGVGWRQWEGISCVGADCPPAALRMSASPGGSAFTRITVRLTGNASVDLETAPVRMLSADRFDDEGAAVYVDAIVPHVGANVGSVERVHAQDPLWGAATKRSPTAGTFSFELERPDGTRAEAHDAWLFAEPPGTYTFHAERATAGLSGAWAILAALRP